MARDAYSRPHGIALILVDLDGHHHRRLDSGSRGDACRCVVVFRGLKQHVVGDKRNGVVVLVPGRSFGPSG